MTQYVVTAPLIVVTTLDGSTQYLNQGATVPANANNVAALLANGSIGVSPIPLSQAATSIRTVRNTAALWAQLNPVLAYDQQGLESDTGLIKVGDGVTPWNSLSYGGTFLGPLDARYSAIGSKRPYGTMGGKTATLFARNMPGPTGAERLSPVAVTPAWSAGSATTISSGIQLANGNDATKITFCGAGALQPSAYVAGYYFPSWRYPASGYDNTPSPGAWAVQFHTDSRYIEFAVTSGSTSPAYMLVIDGQPTAQIPTQQVSTGTSGSPVQYMLKFDLGASAWRKIRLEIQDFGIGGIYGEGGSSIAPAPPVGPRVLLISDSYGEGANVTGSAIGSFFFRLCRYMGVEDAWQGAKGGSGWVAASSVTPTQAVTFTAGTNVMSMSTAHGMYGSEHGAVVFASVDAATGLLPGVAYYAQSAPSGTSLILSATPGGAVLPIAASGVGVMQAGYSYPSRIVSDVVPAKPDVVLFFSFYNDRNKMADGVTGGATGSQAAVNVAAAAALGLKWLFSSLASAPPQVYVFGACDPNGNNPEVDPDLSIDIALAAACAAKGVPYASPQSGAIYDGSGLLIATETQWINTVNRSMPVTFDTATSSATFASEHELTIGQRLSFFSVSSVVGVSATTTYYVQAITSPTAVKLSTTFGGSAITISTAGTGVAGWNIQGVDNIHPTFRGQSLIARRMWGVLSRLWNT